MKKRNLVPKDSIVTGDEFINTHVNRNYLPLLPKRFPYPVTQAECEIVQAYFFVHGNQVNERTNSHIREVLRSREGSMVMLGGIVSDYAFNGKRILIEFPRTLHMNDDLDGSVDIIDSHLWLKIDEFYPLREQQSQIVSLGDYIIVAGYPNKYTSRGKEKYSLTNWGIVTSGLFAVRDESEPLNIIKDYHRTGWVMKINITNPENDEYEGWISAFDKINEDKKTLINIFKDRVKFQKKPV